AGGVGGPTVTLPYWVKLTRLGSTFTGSISSDGVSWTQVGSATIPMAASVYMGLAVTARDTSAAITATFDNVGATSTQDFILSVSLTAVSAGSNITFATSVVAIAGFNGVVSFSAGGVPSGASSSFSPASVTGSGSSTLIMTPGSAAPGGYPLTITPTSGGRTHSSTIYFTVGNPVLSPWTEQDIGNTGVTGNATFSGATFTVSGAGSETDTGATDAFHFVYQPLNGDGTIVARIASIGQSNRRAGVMIRETLDAASANAFVELFNGAAVFAYRSSTAAGPANITT